MRRQRWVISGLLVAMAGCRSQTADLGMSDSAFVTVMSELKAVELAPGITPAARAQRRDAVLRKRGVTAAQIEALSDELTSHPNHAKRLWLAIDIKAEKLAPKGPAQ